MILDDLDTLNYQQLYEIMKKANIRGRSKMSVPEMRDKILQDQKERPYAWKNLLDLDRRMKECRELLHYIASVFNLTHYTIQEINSLDRYGFARISSYETDLDIVMKIYQVGSVKIYDQCSEIEFYEKYASHLKELNKNNFTLILDLNDQPAFFFCGIELKKYSHIFSKGE